MLGFTKTTSSKASDRLRLAMDQWKIQPPPAEGVAAPPAQRVRALAGEADSTRPPWRFTWSPRSLKALGVITALIILFLCFQWWTSQPGGISPIGVESATAGAFMPEEDSGGLTLSGDSTEGSGTGVGGVTVHVAGAVKSPGLYQLPLGSRVADAVEQAGGVTKKSAADSVNLARELVDGEQILVGASGSSTPAGISINSASATQLEELPGVGPVLAERIVNHRASNGPFTSVDQLGDVSGIGDSVLEQIRTIATL